MFHYFPEFIEGVSLFSVKGDKLSKLRCEYPMIIVVLSITITSIIVVVVIATTVPYFKLNYKSSICCVANNVLY